jgi:hypothetical protein
MWEKIIDYIYNLINKLYMFKNMNQSAYENDNLYSDAIESSEEKSLSAQDIQTNGNNLMISIPKFDNNVFLKYEYQELVNQRLEKLGIPCNESLFLGEEKLFSSKEKFFAEDNVPGNSLKISQKKHILMFKQLKNFVKLKVNIYYNFRMEQLMPIFVVNL